MAELGASVAVLARRKDKLDGLTAAIGAPTPAPSWRGCSPRSTRCGRRTWPRPSPSSPPHPATSTSPRSPSCPPRRPSDPASRPSPTGRRSSVSSSARGTTVTPPCAKAAVRAGDPVHRPGRADGRRRQHLRPRHRQGEPLRLHARTRHHCGPAPPHDQVAVPHPRSRRDAS
ncbi:hypothetical protein [Nonomuraea sp. GTA35]|uniref:hypothetical protein n=1 Tax=Nonomuraea sp. GTA35 TaxID=1676746 RepID=UPI0035C1E387